MTIFGRTDRATLGGIAIGLAGLLVAFRFEGIQLYEITHLSAALIVFCGTAGAVLMSAPADQVKKALRLLPSMLWHSAGPANGASEIVVNYARAARSRGLVALEKDVELIVDPFFRKGMRLAVDGVNRETIQNILDADIHSLASEAEAAAALYESAAGYAPTFGMAGAAIGLVQVMKHLQNIDQVGSGVAAAFVATIYGVLLANLLLLPIASKIRARSQQQTETCRLLLEGIVQIAAGSNPTLIQQRLEPLTRSSSAASGTPAGWTPQPAELSAEAHG